MKQNNKLIRILSCYMGQNNVKDQKYTSTRVFTHFVHDTHETKSDKH